MYLSLFDIINNILYNTLKSTIKDTIMTITANDLKLKGVSVLESMLNTIDEVLISVRGKNKYVVVDMERYKHLRECEIEQAYQEVQQNIKDGKFKAMTAEEHIEALERVL